MNKIKLKDIIPDTPRYIEIYSNPDLLEQEVICCNVVEDTRKNIKKLIYQVSGMPFGVLFHCKITEDNKDLLNRSDFPYLQHSLKNIQGIELYRGVYIKNELKDGELSVETQRQELLNFNFDYVEKLKKKYDLPEDFIKCFGDNEPLYKKMTQSRIVIQPQIKSALNMFYCNEKPLQEMLGNDIEKLLNKGLRPTLIELKYFLHTLIEIAKTPNLEAKEEWHIGKDENITSQSLYIVQHQYDKDVGYEYEEFVADTLFATTDSNMAKEFVEKYKDTVSNDKDSVFTNRKLKIIEVPLVQSIDMSKITPAFFGCPQFSSIIETKQNDKINDSQNYSCDDLEY